MDVDAYVALHRHEWERLDELARRASRPHRLAAGEADELVALYQRTATHLSVVRTASPDPVLVERLSGLVTRARGAVVGARESGWHAVPRFFAVTFPAAVWVRRWWVIAAALASIVVGVAFAVWVAGDPQVQSSIAAPEEIRQLVTHEFRDYYSSDPAGSFAAKVWTNNVWVAAGCICLGALFGLPTVYLLLLNAANVGVSGGLMAANGRLGEFFGLILPHGLLELTAVFVAAGAGLRLGWRLIDPGPRTRGEAVAEEGRAAVAVALGLVFVLLCSGVVEAFVTPSGLPTGARIGVGVAVWLAFIAWITLLGRPAAARGETGDLEPALRGDRLAVG